MKKSTLKALDNSFNKFYSVNVMLTIPRDVYAQSAQIRYDSVKKLMNFFNMPFWL